MSTKARSPFWLDGGYDFDAVAACPYHPVHRWQTVRLGDVLHHPANPDELFTICRGCYVPRCGSTGDRNRCLMWRHHECLHVYENGTTAPVGVYVRS